jgi:hypothetical protein
MDTYRRLLEPEKSSATRESPYALVVDLLVEYARVTACGEAEETPTLRDMVNCLRAIPH